MEYLVRVRERMRVWQVINGDAEEAEPIEAGQYVFIRIPFPLKCRGSTDWIALKDTYAQSEGITIVGRSADIVADKERQQKEELIIEVIVPARQGSKSLQEKQPVR